MSTAPLAPRDTRQRLIDAARALMTEQDILEVSVAEITQRAGVNVALVSYHFGGREGLMLAVAMADAEKAIGSLDALLRAPLSPPEKLRLHIGGVMRTYLERPYLHRLLQKLIREGSPEAMRQVGDRLIRPVAQARQGMIAQGMASGDFRAVDVRFIGYAIEGACAHIFSSAASREVVLGSGKLDPAVVGDYGRAVADLIVRGLMLRPN